MSNRGSAVQLPALLEVAALRHPKRVALIDATTSMTYEQVHRAALQMRAKLAAEGVHQGDAVAIRLRNTAQHVVALLGSIYAGTTIVPISDRLTEDDVRYIVSDSDALALLQDVDLGNARLDDDQGRRPVTIAIDQTQVGTDHESDVGIALDQVQASFLSYTSGTSGQPKGVVMSASSRSLLVARVVDYYGIDDQHALLCSVPIAHAAGLTFSLAHLIAGGTVILDNAAFSPEVLAARAQRNSITSVLLVPTMLESLARSNVAASDLTSVRRWIVMGSPLSPETDSKFAAMVPNAAIWQYYGATESPHMTLMRPDEKASRPDSVGRAYPEVQLQIRDGDDQPITSGDDGEIWARSPWMLSSYHKKPAATAEALHDGWYRTGDVGHLDPEGYLFLTGRKRDVIISGGLNIYPAEIESVLLSHPSVVEAAVIGAPDSYWGEKVVAVVVCSAPVDPHELIEHCREHLASYKKPSLVVFVTRLPHTHMGKVDKKLLARLYEGA